MACRAIRRFYTSGRLLSGARRMADLAVQSLVFEHHALQSGLRQTFRSPCDLGRRQAGVRGRKGHRTLPQPQARQPAPGRFGSWAPDGQQA